MPGTAHLHQPPWTAALGGSALGSRTFGCFLRPRRDPEKGSPLLLSRPSWTRNHVTTTFSTPFIPNMIFSGNHDMNYPSNRKNTTTKASSCAYLLKSFILLSYHQHPWGVCFLRFHPSFLPTLGTPDILGLSHIISKKYKVTLAGKADDSWVFWGKC